MGLEGRELALREWQEDCPQEREGGEDTWCGRVVSVARQTERKGVTGRGEPCCSRHEGLGGGGGLVSCKFLRRV